MSFHVYMLRCADGSYYVSQTDELESRMAQHQAGEMPGYTQGRRPVELVFAQHFGTRDVALAAERQIKGWSRAKKEALIQGDFEAVRASDSLSGLSSRLRSTTARHALMEGEGAEPAETGVENSAQMPQPLIILVRPQLGENIGKAARAMLNFGLTEMRLVAPRDGWPNPDAGPSSAGADEVLEKAQVFETLADAVADCAHVFATTVRKRGVTKPVVTPEGAAQAIVRQPGRSAIVFGPERSGLETEEVALARTILTVPVNPDFGSLNLAQAVILCAYEWSKHVNAPERLVQPTVTDILEPAPQGELDGMIAQLDQMLEAAGYFYPPDRAPATRRTLRGLLTKPGWNTLEVRTLRGVLSALADPRER